MIVGLLLRGRQKVGIINQYKNKVKYIVSAVAYVIMVVIVIDLVIVFGGLAQIALEGRTGEWPPLWAEQAKFIINLLN